MLYNFFSHPPPPLPPSLFSHTFIAMLSFRGTRTVHYIVYILQNQSSKCVWFGYSRTYGCEFCGKTFTAKDKMILHRRLHTTYCSGCESKNCREHKGRTLCHFVFYACLRILCCCCQEATKTSKSLNFYKIVH
jgi:hypothetical protein